MLSDKKIRTRNERQQQKTKTIKKPTRIPDWCQKCWFLGGFLEFFVCVLFCWFLQVKVGFDAEWLQILGEKADDEGQATPRKKKWKNCTPQNYAWLWAWLPRPSCFCFFFSFFCFFRKIKNQNCWLQAGILFVFWGFCFSFPSWLVHYIYRHMISLLKLLPKFKLGRYLRRGTI